MSLVSNERAQEIRECVDAQDLVAETFGVNLKTSLMIAELLADREWCKRDKEAVIVKLENDIDWLENVVRPTYKPGKFQMSYQSGCLIAYKVILAFIRNPKEDTIGDTDR